MKYKNITSSLGSFLLAVIFISFASGDVIKHVQDKATLLKVKTDPSGSVVFFGHSSDQPEKEVVLFNREFKKAAVVLKDFGVKFYIVECGSNSPDFKEECSHSNYVMVYSLERKEEMSLSILFDEDHIVGHVLMFVLQNDVEIAQDKYMWDEVLLRSKGSKDIILAYVKGMGDKDHRYFMETAFVYGKEYKFVVTTEKSMPGVQGDAALWFYSCKDVSEGKDCPFKTRKMPPKSVLDVLRFINVNSLPQVVEMMGNGSTILDKQDKNFPLSKVFLFSKNIEKARSMALEAVKDVDDSFVFILVQVDTHMDMLPEYGVNPAQEWDEDFVTLVLQPAHLVGSEQPYYEQWPIDIDFNVENMVRVLNQYHNNPNKAYIDIVKGVNVLYEQIGEWKKPSSGVAVVGGCMEEMPECVAFNIMFRRIARSIVYSFIEETVDITYVDFTGKPEDAKLNSLPGFMIFKNGREIKHRGKMDYESLLLFVWETLSAGVLRFPLSGSDHIPLAPEEYDERAEGETEEEYGQDHLLSMEDDTMGKLAVDIVKRKVQDEIVEGLTDKTFNSTRESHDLMVTLFFLPWCVKSIITRESYAQVVKRITQDSLPSDISTSVNKVNCFDWEDVCQKENVVSYPTVKVYRKGLEPIVYSNSLDVETMTSTIKRYQVPVLKELKDSKSIKAFLDVKTPSLSQVSVIGLFDSANNKELQTFKTAAEKLSGQYTFAFAAGKIAKESAKDFQFPMPSFVLLKRNDPVEKMTGSGDFSKISEFIEENSLPLYGELTALNFPRYRMYGKPLVIQFRDSKYSDVDETMKIVAIQDSSVFVTWMDKGKNVTKDIMRAYLKQSSDPAVVLVSHEQGKVYKYDGEIEEESLLKWVKNCLAEKLKATTTLSDKKWTPLRKGFNYLYLVERAAKEKREAREAYTSEQEVESVDHGEVEVEGNDEERQDGEEKEPGEGEEGREDDNEFEKGDGYEEQESKHDEL